MKRAVLATISMLLLGLTVVGAATAGPFDLDSVQAPAKPDVTQAP